MRSRKLRRAVKLAWSAGNVTMPFVLYRADKLDAEAMDAAGAAYAARLRAFAAVPSARALVEA